MNKIIITILIGVVVILGLGYLLYMLKPAQLPEDDMSQQITPDVKNATYVIEGQRTTLINGRAEKEVAAGSASKMVTQYFGNEAKGDFNNDGKQDIAFLLTQNTGGSGTFYYVTVLASMESNYTSTNAILLGDRIAPQTTEFRDGAIIVDYADRKPGEPMTATPSVGVSKYFTVTGSTLAEVEK